VASTHETHEVHESRWEKQQSTLKRAWRHHCSADLKVRGFECWGPRWTEIQKPQTQKIGSALQITIW